MDKRNLIGARLIAPFATGLGPVWLFARFDASRAQFLMRSLHSGREHYLTLAELDDVLLYAAFTIRQ